VTTPPIIKCPFCEYEAENEKWLEHHIQYTLKPNHPKIEEYLREHKPKLIQEQKSLPATVALSDSEEEEKDQEIIEEVEEEEKLSFVSLSLDAKRILINDSPTCNSYLPKNISSHDANQRRRIVEGLILKACSEYNVDYVSEDNITLCAKEVVEQMYQRFRALQKQEEREEKKGEDTKTLLAERSEMDERTKIISYLTGAVMNTVHVKTLLDTGEMLYYDRKKNIFRFGGERIIDMEIEKLGGFGVVTNGEKYEVRKHIADNTGVDRGVFDESANPYIINLENCRLNTITWQQLPQTAEENLTLSKFPIKYDPNAECPIIEKFFGEVILDPHKLREVLKFWGYVLLKDCRYEKALLPLGGGSNGKSVMIKLFEAAVGEESCSHLSLHELEEDRFGRAQLFGKILNTYADMKSGKLRDTGNLKTAISGDTIEGQHKFRDRFKFRNRAKIIVSTNNPPETDDKTFAFYRRWLIVTFDRTFTESSEDPNDPNKVDVDLIKKLTTPEELSGFLNLGLKYLQVLINENGFAEEPIDKIRRAYEFKADQVKRWLEECCIIDFNRGEEEKDYETRTETLYNHYRQWCKERADQIIPLDENVFGSKLTEHGIQKKRKRTQGEGRRQVYFYKPIVLKHVLREEKGQGDIISAIEQTAAEQVQAEEEEKAKATQNKVIIECPYCAVDNEAGNSPLFQSCSLRAVQLHIIFKHPMEHFDALERV
jgi:P4 family phage/plasmid primase-like protien